MGFKFNLIKKDKNSQARIGKMKTEHGEIETPVFMPVGTLASVKTLSPDELKVLNSEIILGNTYHLYLRPGIEIVKKMGGLHGFMNWDRPILTDSGGYQVFSLGSGYERVHESDKKSLVKIKEDGVEFRSHLDGSKHFFTPENVIDKQMGLGADIMMVLDECAPHTSSEEYAREAMARTHDWAKKAIDYWRGKPKSNQEKQALFGIVQGVIYDDLRKESAKYISSLDFDGVAVGGLSVGEDREDMYHTLDIISPILPEKKPRYLMGVGEPIDLLEAVDRGIDMFDCVLPTRIARNGALFTKKGRINLVNSKNTTDKAPIEKGCECYACQNFSRAYISHLIKEREVLGIRLTTIHNLHFILSLMKDMREAIKKDQFKEFKKDFIQNYKGK